MAPLLDTGVLLRLFDRADPAFPAIRDCVRRLRRESDRPYVTMQNLAEFWNVTTRPTTARGGYGASIALAEKRLQFLESICEVLYPNPQSLQAWRDIVVTNRVHGVQVHDAHLAAVMRVFGITRIMTLNKTDFARFMGIDAVTPDEALANWPSGKAST